VRNSLSDSESIGVFGPEEILAAGCHSAVGRLVNYWRSIHPQAGLPGRRDVDPVAIPHLLDRMWMLDVETEPRLRFRFRLVSAKNTAVLGNDLTNHYVDDLVSNFQTTVTYRALSTVVEKGLPNWRRGEPDLPHIDEFLDIERVMLPLATDSRSVDVILGLSVFYRKNGSEF